MYTLIGYSEYTRQDSTQFTFILQWIIAVRSFEFYTMNETSNEEKWFAHKPQRYYPTSGC